MSNTKPDFSRDPELVECAKATARVYSPRDAWEDFTPHMKEQLLKWSAAARDFFRERWKPGPMLTPDLSRDPERVQLAKVLREAVRSTFRSVSVPNWETMDPEWKREYLFMADAAITHLGSGYRLPEATEANAERLARAKYDIDYPRLEWFFDTSDEQRRVRVGDAVRYLRALHAMMAEKPELERCSSHRSYNGCELKDGHDGPHKAGGLTWPAEKPEPRTADDWLPRCPVTLDGKRCNLAVHADDVNHDNGETSWLEAQPLQKAQQYEPRKMSPAERGKRRRERQQLVWEMAKQLVAEPIEHGARHVRASIQAWDALIREAADGADRYLAWRDADDKKEMEASCK